MSIMGLLFPLLSQDRFHETNSHETHKFSKPLLEDFLKRNSPKLVKKYGGANVNFMTPIFTKIINSQGIYLKIS